MTDLDAQARAMADEGKLIEAGWLALRALAISPDAPAVQLNEMRMAYMAGAQHLFASIISLLDEGQESTESDLRRMDLISAELDAYRRELEWRSWW